MTKKITKENNANETLKSSKGYISIFIEKQMFGICIDDVHDVFIPPSITKVPLSMPEVAGVLNLRGHIVTTINMRYILGLPPKQDGGVEMAVGVMINGVSYGLIIDNVGDVMTINKTDIESNPSNMSSKWNGICEGVFRLEDNIMVILDMNEILGFSADSNVA